MTKTFMRNAAMSFLAIVASAGMLDAQEFHPSRLLVRYRSQQAARVVGGLNARIAHRFRNSGISLLELGSRETVGSAIAKLRRDPNVLYAEPDYRIEAVATPDDSYYSSLWGIMLTRCPEAWAFGTGSRNVIVAVIDSGVDYNHPDLAANMWVNDDEIPGNGVDDDGNGYVDDVNGFDFYNYDADPMDDNGHGTHCAGTVGAVGFNGTGVIGVAPGVLIMPVKFLNADGSGWMSQAIRAIEYAVNNGASVLSNSWGGGGYLQGLNDAIETARQRGVIFIAAAGNNSSDNDQTPFYPAGYDCRNIVSIGASDRDDARASFSNFGKTTVDLYAPGVDILSTAPSNSYRSLSGTSMATPHVAGTVALLLSGSGSLAPASVRQMLIDSCDPSNSLTQYCVSGGRLNAEKLIISTYPSPSLDIATVTIEGGNGNRFAESGEELKLSIEIKNCGEVLRGLTATLTSHDGSVSVVQPLSRYPDMPGGATSSNTTPFVVRINTSGDYFRESSLILLVESSFTGAKEILKVPLLTGKRCDVLLVDDDNGSVTDSIIAESLKRCGWDPYVWDISKRGIPPIESMNTSLVIWNTGNAGGVCLSPDELNTIRRYCSLDGALMMAGDEWADSLSGDPLLASLFKTALDAQDAAPCAQTGMHALAGVSFDLPSIAVNRDRLRAANGGMLVTSDSGSSVKGSTVLAPTSDASGPVLSASFDISYLAQSDMDRLVDKAVKVMMRPTITSLTPRNGAVDLCWRLPSSGACAEIRVIEPSGAVSTLRAPGAGITLTGLENEAAYRISMRTIYADGAASEWCRNTTVTPSAAGGSPLQAVDGVTASPGVNGVHVSWRPSVDSRVCGYAVEIGGSDVTGVFTSADSSFLVGRRLLNAHCSGTVTVYPLDQNGCRGLPAVAAWSYSDVYPPEDVLNIQITDLGYNRIRVTWSPSASQDVSCYIVDMKSRGGEFGAPSASVSSTSVIISDISESISSQIRVRCADDAGNTSPGAIVDFGEDGRGSSISYCGCGTTPDNQSDGYSESGSSGLMLGLACNFLTVGFGMALAAIRRFSRRKRP